MTPTTRLRFVERDYYEPLGDGLARITKKRVLQQWWESEGLDTCEWRDVPLEVDEGEQE